MVIITLQFLPWSHAKPLSHFSSDTGEEWVWMLRDRLLLVLRLTMGQLCPQPKHMVWLFRGCPMPLPTFCCNPRLLPVIMLELKCVLMLVSYCCHKKMVTNLVTYLTQIYYLRVSQVRRSIRVSMSQNQCPFLPFWGLYRKICSLLFSAGKSVPFQWLPTGRWSISSPWTSIILHLSGPFFPSHIFLWPQTRRLLLTYVIRLSRAISPSQGP